MVKRTSRRPEDERQWDNGRQTVNTKEGACLTAAPGEEADRRRSEESAQLRREPCVHHHLPPPSSSSESNTSLPQTVPSPYTTANETFNLPSLCRCAIRHSVDPFGCDREAEANVALPIAIESVLSQKTEMLQSYSKQHGRHTRMQVRRPCGRGSVREAGSVGRPRTRMWGAH